MYTIEKINTHLTLATLDLSEFTKEYPNQNKRDIERSGIRYLMRILFKDPAIELAYTNEGKPFLKGTMVKVSISHSHDKLVLLLNEKEETGVDIELIRDKVKNIEHKFLSKDEKAFVNGNIELMITLWAAKEAIYKAYGLKSVDFIKNILIENLTLDDENFFGRMELQGFKKRYLLSRRRIDNYILVLILGEV